MEAVELWTLCTATRAGDLEHEQSASHRNVCQPIVVFVIGRCLETVRCGSVNIGRCARKRACERNVRWKASTSSVFVCVESRSNH